MPSTKPETISKPTHRIGSANVVLRSKRKTKKDQLVKLLRAKRGVAVCTLSEKLGWQKHTTRAALTRLRQSGFELIVLRSSKDKPTRYRIAADPSMVGQLEPEFKHNA